MAFRFGKPKPPDDENPEAPKDALAFEPQPEKARRWFEHARVMSDSSNFDSALVYYAHGIGLDPSMMSAHEAMYEAAVQYFNKGSRPASGKEIRKLEGPHPVEKFAVAEFAWMKDINNASLALKLLEAIVKAEQFEFGHWFAPKALNVLLKQKKPSKSAFLQAKTCLAEIGAWNEALRAGEAALIIDPLDTELESDLKDLSAQRAMDEGRYEEAGGEEGGFRKFVLDADKQRELEEAGSIAAGQSMEQRNLQRALKEYEKSPATPDVLNRYAQLLKVLGTPEAEQQSYDVYMKGFQDTNEYRFRALAGDIKIEQAQRRVDELQEKLDGHANDGKLIAAFEQARKTALDLRYGEYNERTAKYPTDRRIKYQLGEVEFEMGRYMDAMKRFQDAKDEPRLRVQAGHMLGRCFAEEAWHIEAIQAYKQVLEHVEATEKEMELAIRYDLMVSLMANAREERSLDLSKEARAICTSILQQDVTYRDIRSARKEVDQLIKELSGRPLHE